MQIRRASSLIFYLAEDNVITGYNFLTNSGFNCDPEAIRLLSALSDWTDFSNVVDDCDGFAPQSVAAQIVSLVKASAIVARSTESGVLDDEYRNGWEWGASAGFFHFGLRDCSWSTQDDAYRFLNERAQSQDMPRLYVEHDMRIARELPIADETNGLAQVMAKRRSNRVYSNRAISLEALVQCLFSGFGIVAFADDPLLGRLPFKWAPSPGARNPFEAYVYVRHVTGLEPGLYHYSGFTHSLMTLGRRGMPSIGDLLAEQKNLDESAAVVFLVANFDRTMWKYPHPNGYRAVLIEAGHITQNILLSATQQNIASLPTCATNDAMVRQFLALNQVRQSPIHAVVLGVKDDRGGDCNEPAVASHQAEQHDDGSYDANG